MYVTKKRSLAVATAAAIVLGGSSAAVMQPAVAHGPENSTAAASHSPAEEASPGLRGEAEMPERITPSNYEYAQALMQLPTHELEPTFMGEIIVHHQAVIEMSRIAMEKAEHPELESLAGMIINAQQHQIEEFTQLLDSKYGLTPEEAREQAPGEIPQILQEVNESLEEKVATVREAPAGSEFDRIWLSEVVPHHQTGILQFQAVQAGAEDPRLLLMANMGIGSQEMEIVQMLNWLIQWYGDEAGN